ncbi:EpsG family protein [Aeromonas enteropelogenes]|uniref:EpsG family protein n=1 Tax=Aeromonas enteropelogenes TaxID=29489 RepID=UPI00191D2ECB|nr:EpsG family protein [Aeromonas enteropelogenes]MBL0455925.1 EpsG family protein [Aeromonas enteropelogenes]
MLIYFFPVFLSAVLFFVFQFQKLALISFMSLCVLVLSYIVGYRYYSDPDYAVYIEYIKMAENLDIYQYFSNFYVEPIFFIAAKCFSEHVFFFFAFVSLGLLVYFCNKQGRLWGVLFSIIMANIFYICFYIQVRWGLALVFLLLSLHYYYLKNNIKSLLFFVLSLASHLSVIIFLPLFYKKVTAKPKIAFIISLFVILVGVVFDVRSLSLFSSLIEFSSFFPYLEFKLKSYLIAFKNVEVFFYFIYLKYVIFILVVKVVNGNVFNVKSNWLGAFFITLLMFSIFIDVGVLAQRLYNIADVLFCLFLVDVFNQRKFTLIDWILLLAFLLFSWVFSLVPMLYKGYLLPYEHWVM